MSICVDPAVPDVDDDAEPVVVRTLNANADTRRHHFLNDDVVGVGAQGRSHCGDRVHDVVRVSEVERHTRLRRTAVATLHCLDRNGVPELVCCRYGVVARRGLRRRHLDAVGLEKSGHGVDVDGHAGEVAASVASHVPYAHDRDSASAACSGKAKPGTADPGVTGPSLEPMMTPTIGFVEPVAARSIVGPIAAACDGRVGAKITITPSTSCRTSVSAIAAR